MTSVHPKFFGKRIHLSNVYVYSCYLLENHLPENFGQGICIVIEFIVSRWLVCLWHKRMEGIFFVTILFCIGNFLRWDYRRIWICFLQKDMDVCLLPIYILCCYVDELSRARGVESVNMSTWCPLLLGVGKK
jgi:hypothetical protein